MDVYKGWIGDSCFLCCIYSLFSLRSFAASLRWKKEGRDRGTQREREGGISLFLFKLA